MQSTQSLPQPAAERMQLQQPGVQYVLQQGPQPAQMQPAMRQLQPNAQGMQCLPQMAAAPARPTILSAPLIKLDELKQQVQLCAEPQLDVLAANVAAEAVRQCAQQVSHPAMVRSTTDTLAKALRDNIGDVDLLAAAAVQAVTTDVLSALQEPSNREFGATNMEEVFRQVITSTARMNRTELLPAKLQSKLNTGKPINSLVGAIEDSLESYLLESYQSAVATMSHFFLKQAVEAVVRPLLEPVIAELSDQMLQLVQSQSLLPTIGDSVRQAAKNASKQAAATAWQTCRSSARNVALTCNLPVTGATTGTTAGATCMEQVRLTVKDYASYPQMRSAPPMPPPSKLGTVAGSGAGPAAGPVGPASATSGRPQPAQPLLVTGQTQQPALPVVNSVLTSVAAPTLAVTNATSCTLSTPSTLSPIPSRCYSPTGTVDMSEGECPCPSVISIDLTSEPDLSAKRTATWSASTAATQQPPAADYHSSTTVDALSDEVLSLILAFVEPFQLASCARVSLRWRDVCQGLWGRTTLRYEPRFKQRFSSTLLVAPELALLDCERMACGRTARAAVPQHARNALLETECQVRGLRFPTEDFDPDFVIAVLTKHADTLESLDLSVTRALCEYSSPDSPSQLFSLIDSMGSLKKLRLAGFCDVEYSFRARPLGAPARSLQVLDLRDYHASSAHTISTLIRAHHDSLQEALLSPRTRDEEVINLSLCPSLRRLTLPVDMLMRCRPAAFSAVVSLVLTQSGPFPLPEASPAKRRKTFMLPSLQDLTLDGVTKYSFIPKPIRAAFDQVRSLRLVRTSMASSLIDLVREMPLLQRLDVDFDATLSVDVLQALPRVAPRLEFIHLALRCNDSVCWKPAAMFVCKAWPDTLASIDLVCGCLQ